MYIFVHCRQQLDYKLQLCKTDTSSLSLLVGGCRRKTDGSRFHVGGVDISFIKGNNSDACACLSVLRMPDLEVFLHHHIVELVDQFLSLIYGLYFNDSTDQFYMILGTFMVYVTPKHLWLCAWKKKEIVLFYFPQKYFISIS